MKFKNFMLAFLFLFVTLQAQTSEQTFISLKNTGVAEFRKAHPKYDGRGTIVIVLDTGVDMGIPGLKKTSTGKTKVIDVQDFTGEGDVQLYKADVENRNDTTYFVNEEKNFRVAASGGLPLTSLNGEYYIGRVVESRWLNSSSGATDVNGNGTTNDKFYILAFETKDSTGEYWVAFFDTNSNGDLTDEKPLRDYKIKYDTFQIPNDKGLPYFTFAINIFPKEKKVSLFYDDGAHGTHCAGIATGNRIGDENFYGIAPGANLIALKIGNNNFSGGATVTESMKKAFKYADKISRQRKEPCIINMSYGIGSEIEGRAEIERFLEKLTQENPYLYISTANGNEGPGISTTGLPAATKAVFSSGAVLAADVAHDLYGAVLKRDIVLFFSSRGGEVAKPDVVSPGACVSTVPNWSYGDRFWGTSMASPYSAGVMSLLLSAMRQEFPKVKIPSQFLYKAIRRSAVWQKGYSHLDQGEGMINVMNAYALLRKWIKSGELKRFETYTITSFAQTMPNNRAWNLYIRNGRFLTGNESFGFSIKRNNLIHKKRFYRIYRLKSDAKWLKLINHRTYIRNNQRATVNVKIDRTLLKNPGVYNAEIIALRDDKSEFPEFSMWATVVIPYEFNAGNFYTLRKEYKALAPGDFSRLFIDIPAGATSMTIQLNSKARKYAFCWYFLSAPNGEPMDRGFLNGQEEEGANFEKNYFNLQPGVYEVDILGYYRSKAPSTFDAVIKFGGINILNKHTLTKNDNSLTILNEFNRPENVRLEAAISGYQRNRIVKLDSTDIYRLPFKLVQNEKSKTFKIILSKEDFNKTTDFAIQIYDSTGKAIRKTGLSYREETISISGGPEKGSASYVLELRPAFALHPEPMKIKIKETTLFKEETPVNVTHNGSGFLTLYPSIAKRIDFNFEKEKVSAPEGSEVFGKLLFKSKDKTIYESPIFFNF